YFLICSRRKRKQPTYVIVSIDLTSVCLRTGLFTPQGGQDNKSKRAICRSGTSARARAEPQRWWQRRKFHKMPAPSFHEVDVPISPATRCQTCRRRRCSSLAATMTL